MDEADHFQQTATGLSAFYAEIMGEIHAHNQTFGKADSPHARRSMVRSLFSCMEAHISHLKGSALLFSTGERDTFTPAEILALQDLEPFIDDKGKVSTRRAKVPFKANLRLGFRLLGRAMGKEIELDFSSPGGTALANAIRVRDRITHPKTPECWKVSEAEAAEAVKGWEWMGEHLLAVIAPRVQRIVSGGQTGADRAALDTAIALGIRHGGKCPKGRRAEDGPIPNRYRLEETPSPGYLQQNKWNVQESDGTVIFTMGPLSGGSGRTAEFAEKHGKPWVHIPLAEVDDLTAAKVLITFINECRARVLNVAGTRGSKEPELYGRVVAVLTLAHSSGGLG